MCFGVSLLLLDWIGLVGFFPFFFTSIKIHVEFFEFVIKIKKRKSNIVKYQGCLNNIDGSIPWKKSLMFSERHLIIKRQRKIFLEIKKVHVPIKEEKIQLSLIQKIKWQ